ncbi:MAG: NAD+ synthase [Candidatus Methylacidiphilales bacterium]
MKLALLQVNTTVGDFAGNRTLLQEGYVRAVEAGAQLVVAPELALCGYPPRDWLFYRDFVAACLESEGKLAEVTGSVPLLVGGLTPRVGMEGRPLFNSALWMENGQVRYRIHKMLIPTYDVFDEARYFEPAVENHAIETGGWRVGVSICEDIWNDGLVMSPRLYSVDPVDALVAQGVDVILNLSASPWQLGKEETRKRMVAERARKAGVPVALVNAVGGNDELVFDGHSVVVDTGGEVLGWGQGFAEELVLVDLKAGSPVRVPPRADAEMLMEGLVLGTRDYVRKCGFSKVVLGLSGGIDSALVAVIAARALGSENVLGLLMPSPYSSEGSVEDAAALAGHLGMKTWTLPIDGLFEMAKRTLAPVFSGLAEDVTEENMQARIRGMLVMAVSNKTGRLALTTGNKSELAAGYCTLYGDMCGGLAVINDVSKTQVYALAEWINREGEVIPWNSIHKPPSAELRPGQKDQDTLPPYDLLDRILDGYILENQSVEELTQDGLEDGLNRAMVSDLVRKVVLNEYKRRQAAPGLKVSSKAFGVGRRLPIAQRFRHG